jgi:outer membrane protein TolC
MKFEKLRTCAVTSLLVLNAVAMPAQATQQTPAGSGQTQVNPMAPAPPQPTQNDTTGDPALPQAPAPVLTRPLFLRPTPVNYGNGREIVPNPTHPYRARHYAPPRFSNTARLADLMRNGTVYLSLSDAVRLALENNYDIAIARINLDIADTDLLRARAGGTLRGVSTGVVNNTIGGTSSTITGGGGPGGTTTSAGGSGTGANGLVLSTNGSGPTPENMDPILTGSVQYEQLTSPQSNLLFSGGLPSTNTNTGTYNFGYSQGFGTGTALDVTFNNTRVSTNNPFSTYSPNINTGFRVQATQHLLQGFGTGINNRFVLQAVNNRQITDSAFRQQLLYTVNQVENIYWSLVSAYEDAQDKAHALEQSTQVAADDRRMVAIGTLADLDVVNADSQVASDKQALVASQTNLEYQQLLMKQAMVRNLNDPQFAKAPVIPTDRVALDRLPEEDETVEDLVGYAYANNPQIEQAAVNMKNNQITLKAQRNGLLPVVDLFAFYGGSALAGAQNPGAISFGTGGPYPPGTFPSIPFGDAFGKLFNNSAPDKGVGFNVTINLRNRIAQADATRSQMELDQSQMRLEQLYTQVRIGVINGQFALTNDRAQVAAAQAAHDYAEQSMKDERRKMQLGASTPALVQQQSRSLAQASNQLISANAAYARDRAALLQLTARALDRYGINITAAANGDVSQRVNVPGLIPAPATPTPTPTSPAR